MRACLSITVMIAAAAVCGSLSSQAQKALALPGCEAAPAVRRIMADKLDYTSLDKMKWTDRMPFERKMLEDLMAKYPREFAPAQKYADFMNQYDKADYEGVRAAWVKAASDHPDDPLALLLAGRALIGVNTPEAIRLLDAAKAKAPTFPWPDLYLASVYASGKRADQAKTKENIEAFFAVCPASTEGYAQFLLNKDQPLQPKVAAALRTELAKETDPKRLERYETLWGLEFRTHPPKEHDAIRAQVAEDLKRLEALNPHGNAEWEGWILTGYKQSGASKEVLTAREDRVLHDFPHSEEAYEVAEQRWSKAHKEPEDQTDAAAWARYNKEYEAAVLGWRRDFTDASFLQRDYPFYAYFNDSSVSDKDALEAMESFLQAANDYESPEMATYDSEIAADFLLERKLQPLRVIDMLRQARAAFIRKAAEDAKKDNLSEEEVKSNQEDLAFQFANSNQGILQAAILAGQPEKAMDLKASVEAPVPTEKKLLSDYWANRARLEVLEKHPQDALAYYQLALTTRIEAPKAYHGKVEDDTSDEAHALWKAQGGTETAYAVWSKPAAGGGEQAAEGRWDKATRQIPDFELSDMNGKTWKLKDLAGKTVLINLWATWCGPCQAELPHLEKFYEKYKDRADMQILTFDIDEDLGVLAPYLKEKGFTFPVLPAYSTVVGLLDGFAIPQTWLVDTKGVWQSKQIGFGGGSDADFEKEMLDRVTAGKGGQ